MRSISVFEGLRNCSAQLRRDLGLLYAQSCPARRRHSPTSGTGLSGSVRSLERGMFDGLRRSWPPPRHRGAGTSRPAILAVGAGPGCVTAMCMAAGVVLPTGILKLDGGGRGGGGARPSVSHLGWCLLRGVNFEAGRCLAARGSAFTASR